MIRAIWNRMAEYKKQKFMDRLVARGLKLGKNVRIEGSVYFDPSHCFLISIGDNCIFADGVYILAHDGAAFGYCGLTKIGRVTIKDNCAIAMSTIVFPGVTIGPNSIVGASSVVVRDIPPNCVAAGNPAKIISSLKDYIAKFEEQSSKYRVFSEDEYNIRWITEERRKEMLEYLENNRIAFMRGKTPDISILS